MTNPDPFRALPHSPGTRSSPAALRNRGPILDVLRTLLPRHGLVLEIASGSGEHVVHFAGSLPGPTWQPSEQPGDTNPEALAMIARRIAAAGLAAIRQPIAIDAAADDWPLERADAIICINMVHISPWAATQGLMRGAARLLPPGGPLLLYGPYVRAGVVTVASNLAFDADLKSRNPEWGLRSVETVTAEAATAGLKLDTVHEMPANNLILIYRAG